MTFEEYCFLGGEGLFCIEIFLLHSNMIQYLSLASLNVSLQELFFFFFLSSEGKTCMLLCDRKLKIKF